MNWVPYKWDTHQGSASNHRNEGRFAIDLLNRHSLPYPQKGHGGGSGVYRGAHWHTPREIRALFDGLRPANLKGRSAVFLPSGGPIACSIEHLISHRLPFGAFVVVASDVR